MNEHLRYWLDSYYKCGQVDGIMDPRPISLSREDNEKLKAHIEEQIERLFEAQK